MGFRAHLPAAFRRHPPGKAGVQLGLVTRPDHTGLRRSHIFESTAHFAIPHCLVDAYLCHVKHRKMSVVLHDT